MSREQMEYNMEHAEQESGERRCPGCRNHCPESAPGCERGEKYFRTGEMEERGEGRRERGERGEGRRERRERGEGRREPGERGEGRRDRSERGEGRRERGEHEESYRERGEHGEGYREHGEHGEHGESRHGRGGRGEGRREHGEWEDRRECGAPPPFPGPGCRPGHGFGEHPDFGPEIPFFGEEQEISGLLLRCGHFLMHRHGGGGRGRGQEKILRILTEREGISQKELQEALGVQAGSISEILSKMERRGLILRERDQEDRRKIRLRLTDQGATYLEKEGEPSIERDPYGVLTEEEQEQLKGLLKKLLDDWRNLYGAAH